MARSNRPGKKQQQRPGNRRSGNLATRPSVPAPQPEPVPEFSAVYEPEPGSPYPELLRHPGYAPWRSIAGVVIALALYVLVIQLVAQVTVAIGWLLLGKPETYAAFVASSFRAERPVGLLGTNLGIAALVGVTFVVMLVFNRTRPGWVFSVDGGPRWRYLLVCVPVAFGVFAVTLGLGSVLAPTASAGPEPRFIGFLVVIFLTSPLQAAAEEVFFRGYLMQALGSLVRNPWFGVVVSAVVFALLHGATQSPALFVDRLGFGLVAAVLVLKTGGIEAGIAIHIVNNWLAFGLATLTSSVAGARALTDITWTQAALDVGGFAAFALLAYAIARRWKLRTTVAGDGLGAPGPVQ